MNVGMIPHIVVDSYLFELKFMATIKVLKKSPSKTICNQWSHFSSYKKFDEFKTFKMFGFKVFLLSIFLVFAKAQEGENFKDVLDYNLNTTFSLTLGNRVSGKNCSGFVFGFLNFDFWFLQAMISCLHHSTCRHSLRRNLIFN